MWMKLTQVLGFSKHTAKQTKQLSKIKYQKFVRQSYTHTATLTNETEWTTDASKRNCNSASS